MERCSECSAALVWTGMAGGRLECPVCSKPKEFRAGFEEEETITDLKRAGKCYCHLMHNRTCETCRKKGKS